jgi:TolB-like protein/DNA-binding SARP family transcriptional activator
MGNLPSAWFQLVLLGRFELSGPDGAISVTSKKMAALLAFLACTAPRPHARDRLMALLWGSHFDAQARQNLRQALTRLRRILGDDALVSTGETVALKPGVVASDVARFETLLGDRSCAGLREAVDLYGGRLLGDMSIAEEAWTEWLEAEHRRLEGLALDAMVRLGEQALEQRDHGQALKAAQRAIAVSSLREDAHRLMMRALAGVGRRADALKHHDHVTGLLKRELMVEPDAATVALAGELRMSGQRQPDTEAGQPGDDVVAAPAVDRGSRFPSVAVLPFVQLCENGNADDLRQQYFASGLAEDLIVRLSKFPGLRVIARNSTFTFHGDIDEVQVGRELRARYLVAGSLRRADDCIRLNVRLVDASTGVQLWAERYDRRLGALFEVQDEVTQRIAGMLIGHLRRAEVNAALQKPPERLDAYDLYLRGIAALRASVGAGSTSGSLIADARSLLQQSLAADPRYAPAWISLSVTFMSTWGTRRHEPCVAGEYKQDAIMEQALQCGARAVSLDPSLAEAHAQHGWCLHCSHRRYEAMQAYRQALELNASLADARYSLMLTHAGRHDEAIAFMHRVVEFDPFQRPFHRSFLADPHYLIGDYQTALAVSRAAADGAPAFPRIRIWQAAAAARLGLVEEAQRAVRAVAALNPDLTISRYLDHVRFARAEDARHLAAGLTAAGLPA